MAARKKAASDLTPTLVIEKALEHFSPRELQEALLPELLDSTAIPLAEAYEQASAIPGQQAIELAPGEVHRAEPISVLDLYPEGETVIAVFFRAQGSDWGTHLTGGSKIENKKGGEDRVYGGGNVGLGMFPRKGLPMPIELDGVMHVAFVQRAVVTVRPEGDDARRIQMRHAPTEKASKAAPAGSLKRFSRK